MSLRGGLNTEAYPMIIRTLTVFERDAVRNFYLALPRWPLQIDSTAIPQNSGRAHGVARYSKLRQGNHMHANAVLESTITCPRCGHRKTERMPSDACHSASQKRSMLFTSCTTNTRPAAPRGGCLLPNCRPVFPIVLML